MYIKTITIARKSRAKLRGKGLTGSQLRVYEELCIHANERHILVRKTGAYIAKCLGQSTSYTNRVLRHLDKLGLITRIGHVIRVNVEEIPKIKEKTVRSLKAKASKYIKALRKYRQENRRFHNRALDKSKEEIEVVDREESLDWLRQNYVPVHLRSQK